MGCLPQREKISFMSFPSASLGEITNTYGACYSSVFIQSSHSGAFVSDRQLCPHLGQYNQHKSDGEGAVPPTFGFAAEEQVRCQRAWELIGVSCPQPTGCQIKIRQGVIELSHLYYGTEGAYRTTGQQNYLPLPIRCLAMAWKAKGVSSSRSFPRVLGKDDCLAITIWATGST